MRAGRDTTTGAATRWGAPTLLGALALAGAALLFVLRPLSLVLPAGGLDGSWMAVLGEAATRPARWGVDLAFTYGPASALVSRYYTDGYLAWALPVLLGVALVAGACFARLAALAAVGRRFGALALMITFAAEAAGLAADLAQDQDSFYFALGLALFLLDLRRRPGDRASRAVVLAGAATLGMAALAKTSFGVLALGLFALADVRAALAGRCMPIATPVFLLAALASFLAFGQHLPDLPAYLSLQGQVAAGYGEAMYLAPGRGELLAFLAGSAALVAVAASAGAPGRGGRTFAALGTALVLAIALKAGFVRADTHPQIAWSLLGLAGLAVGAGLVLPRSAAGAAALGAASLTVLWAAAPLFLLADTDRPPTVAGLSEVYRDMGDGLAAEGSAWARFLRDPSAFAADARRAKMEAWAGIRAAQPLPALPGGVDILPPEQSAVLAAGLDYRPRPSFQDYSTYTAGLMAADAAFYAGPEAPRWVILGGAPLDDRYPTSIEGALWPELLRRYEPTRRVGPWVALRRRAEPPPEVLGPPVRVEAGLGERVGVPMAGPVFARIAVRKTLLGQLAAAAFRPPALILRVTLAGGAERAYRFIPALGAGGFLLSPLLADADGVADLGFGLGGDAGGAVVESLAVGGSTWARFFYAPAVAIELRPVAVPAVPPSADARALFDELARALPWRRLVRDLGRADRLDGDRLSVPAPTALAIPTGGARRLRLRFGIEDGAWTDGGMQGVCFAVRSTPDAPAPLWRRCLDPRQIPADRGPQSAAVDLPPGLAAVTAETSCPRSCDWGWSYWSGIGPDE